MEVSHNAGVIRLLSDQVVDQIAAGEVVERPSSVVKELVENSLDAGATEIIVTIDNGGKTFISVSDNGCGMIPEDATLAVRRFATSKIVSSDDLTAVATLGFRGEALSAIAAVSRFRLITRTKDAAEGVVVSVEGGSSPVVQTLAARKGTVIEVSDLFYNVPARRKFIKTERTEASAVKSIITDLSLAFPHCSFTLVNDGVTSFSSGSSIDFYDRARQLKLSGTDPLRVSEDIGTAHGMVRIDAVLSRPAEVSQLGSAKLHLIVNGRIVRDRMLLRAVAEGYGSMIKPGRYPTGVVKIGLPPEELDVNVHPQKSEVRFAHSQIVFLAVAQAISRVVGGVEVATGFASSDSGSLVAFTPSKVMETQVTFFTGRAPEAAAVDSGARSTVNYRPMLSPEAAVVAKRDVALSQLRFVGQVFSCYIILEAANELYLVDMHAAHERIRFNELKKQFLSGSIVAQTLLIPEIVELPEERRDDASQLIALLQRFGFSCELFGESSLVVRSVPSLLSSSSPGAVIAEVLSLFEGKGDVGAVEQHLDAAFATLACHGSIRSGRELEREEVYSLLDTLDATENRAFCPHGRPIARVVNVSELETVFAR